MKRYFGKVLRIFAMTLFVLLFSGIIVLAGESSFEIISQPTDQIVKEGQSASFSVEVDGNGITYQWQISTDGKTWKKSGAESARTSNYTFSVGKNLDGRYQRCIVRDESGMELISDTARVFIGEDQPDEFVITLQPVDQIVKEGETATLSVRAEGTDLTYQWQISNDGGTWKNSGAESAKKPSYSFAVGLGQNGRYQRCVITNSNGEVLISDVAQVFIRMDENFEITSQPVAQSCGIGDEVTFSVEAVGNGLKYQWQFSMDGVLWSSSGAASAKNPNYSFKMGKAQDGRYQRCLITNQSGKVLISDAAQVFLSTETFSITKQPEDQLVETEKEATFTVETSGADLSYQWQVSSDGSTWSNSGAVSAKTPSYSFTVGKNQNGRYQRCTLTSSIF